MVKKVKSQICIVTVTGADQVGIIARLAAAMAKANINIVDVNQRIMSGSFVMTMAVNMAKAKVDIAEIRKSLDRIGQDMGLRITIQDESIFKAMHRI